MNDHPDEVRERQLDQMFDELAGRAVPPDHTARILERTAASTASGAGGAVGADARRTRMLVAALLLFGIGVTIAAAIATRARHADTDDAASGAAASNGGAVAAGDAARSGDPRPGDSRPGDPRTGDPRPGDPELPLGTDPADLAAMRSAEAMLAAERHLQMQLREGRIRGIDEVLPFHRLTGWRYTDGLQGMPDAVRALDGERVLMLGFMLPLDEVQGMREFLLVESLWSCCYGTPPDLNGIVRCVMPAGRELDYLFDPIKVVGTFSVAPSIVDGYCVDVFQLQVEFLEVVE